MFLLYVGVVKRIRSVYVVTIVSGKLLKTLNSLFSLFFSFILLNSDSSLFPAFKRKQSHVERQKPSGVIVGVSVSFVKWVGHFEFVCFEIFEELRDCIIGPVDISIFIVQILAGH